MSMKISPGDFVIAFEDNTVKICTVVVHQPAVELRQVGDQRFLCRADRKLPKISRPAARRYEARKTAGILRELSSEAESHRPPSRNDCITLSFRLLDGSCHQTQQVYASAGARCGRAQSVVDGSCNATALNRIAVAVSRRARPALTQVTPLRLKEATEMSLIDQYLWHHIVRQE